ncbi:MAG: APC family permease [Nitrospirae bacterium]|nr:APC family permease [Nitrospirota bacterium]
MKSQSGRSVSARLKTLVIGGAREIFDPRIFHNITLIAFFAWVGLGADGLSSSCYGPEEAYLALGAHPHLAIFVALASGITVFVISASYSQIIELFPTGGGGYLVASRLLSPKAGMVSGCALLIDYVLTISISVASGADAMFSFLPAGWLAYKLPFGILIVAVLIVLNMRGVKESVMPLVPIFLVFIVTHAFFIIYALSTHLSDVSGVVAATGGDIGASYSELGLFGMLFVILRAFSMGAGTFTGIEAVSNGLPIIREPKVKNGRLTMRYMAVSLAFTVMGLILAYLFFGVQHVPGKTLNAVLFESMTRDWGGGYGYTLVLVTLVSEAVLLFVAAQAGFLDGPRVIANMALDRWFPTKFALLSNRLVTQKGILLMGGAALATMVLSGGSVRFLVVLYSINVFITFFLSHLGLVVHWLREGKDDKDRAHKLIVSVTGLVITGFILVTVTALKFFEGGWITLVITGALIGVALYTKDHYLNTQRMLRRLDGLVEAAGHHLTGESELFTEGPKGRVKLVELDKNSRTAVLLVNGYNGLGLHTLLNVIRLFGGTFRNFVFVQVGVVDAGTFKGVEELERLKAKVDAELALYVNFVNRQGFYGKGYSSFGTDVVEEVAKVTPGIMGEYKNAVFFGGQLVFPDPSILTGPLHNYTIFAVQRHFYSQGIPIVMMPVRV